MLETDHSSGRWSVAPAVITRTPNSDVGVVTGSRTPAFRDELHLAAKRRRIDLHSVPGEQTPEVILVRPPRASGFEELAEDVGATYVPLAAAQIASVLPNLDLELWPEAWPPDGTEDELWLFEPDRLRFVEVPTAPASGLVRVSAFRRTRHLLATGGTWRVVPRAVGVYAELARYGRPVVRWSPRAVGELLVPRAAPLPRLHARAATLCFGTPPELRDETLAYRNVPLSVAVHICRSLRQPDPLEGSPRA